MAPLTMIHEISITLELSGLPVHVYGEISKHKNLDFNVGVYSDLMIKHKTGAVSQIHLDYLQQSARRNGIISLEKGWLSYDFNKKELVGQKGKEDISVIWHDADYDFNCVYIDQMKEFIRYVEEGRVKHKFDLQSSIETLKVVKAHLESNETGSKVQIERNDRFTF